MCTPLILETWPFWWLWSIFLMMIEVLLPFSLPWLIVFFGLVKLLPYYLISLWMVIRFRIGLNFFISILSGVFFLFFVVMYLEVPGIPESLCSVHSKITWILFPFFAIVPFLDYLFFGIDFLQYRGDSFFVDDLQSSGRNVQRNPSVFFGDIESLFGDIGIESSPGLIDGERYVIAKHHLFSCNFTNFRHLPNFWVILLRLQIYSFLAGWTKFFFRNLKFLSAVVPTLYWPIFERYAPDGFPW